MEAWLSTIVGETMAPYASMALVITILIILLIIVIAVIRLVASGTVGARFMGRDVRLQVVDAAPVDGRRRLVLVRRDNVEHLLMIGGHNDLVIESNIAADRRAAKAPAANTAQPDKSAKSSGTQPSLQQAKQVASQPAPKPEQSPQPLATPAAGLSKIAAAAAAAPLASQISKAEPSPKIDDAIQPAFDVEPVAEQNSTVTQTSAAAASVETNRPIEATKPADAPTTDPFWGDLTPHKDALMNVSFEKPGTPDKADKTVSMPQSPTTEKIEDINDLEQGLSDAFDDMDELDEAVLDMLDDDLSDFVVDAPKDDGDKAILQNDVPDVTLDINEGKEFSQQSEPKPEPKAASNKPDDGLAEFEDEMDRVLKQLSVN